MSSPGIIPGKPDRVASDFLGCTPDAVRKVYERSTELLFFLSRELARITMTVHLVESLIEPRHRLLEIVTGYMPPTDVQVNITQCRAHFRFLCLLTIAHCALQYFFVFCHNRNMYISCLKVSGKGPAA